MLCKKYGENLKNHCLRGLYDVFQSLYINLAHGELYNEFSL